MHAYSIIPSTMIQSRFVRVHMHTWDTVKEVKEYNFLRSEIITDAVINRVRCNYYVLPRN